jgi:hypothetical protein
MDKIDDVEIENLLPPVSVISLHNQVKNAQKLDSSDY